MLYDALQGALYGLLFLCVTLWRIDKVLNYRLKLINFIRDNHKYYLKDIYFNQSYWAMVWKLWKPLKGKYWYKGTELEDVV